MAGAFQFDYDTAIREARRLEEAAGMTDRLAGELDTELSNLTAAWDGESSERYLNKGSRLREDSADAARRLRVVAQEVRTVAERMKALEAENIGLMK